ncbi:hypothetical protein GQR36_11045 [Enterococcus termitis]
MNKLTIKIPLFCTAAALVLGMNSVAYAEESTITSSSTAETTTSSTTAPSQRTTESDALPTEDSKTTSSTAVESTEKTEQSTDSEETDSQLYFDDYYLPSNRSDLNPTVQTRSLAPRLSMDVVNAGEGNRPGSHFIDISSHNGSISVANFQK